jgi:hypothetical protein
LVSQPVGRAAGREAAGDDGAGACDDSIVPIEALVDSAALRETMTLALDFSRAKSDG